MSLTKRMTEIEEWDTPFRTRVPLLTRGMQMPVRIPPMGQGFEGVEIWVPEIIPVVQASLIELRTELLIDNRSIEPAIIVGRFLNGKN